MICKKCGKEFFEDWRRDKATRKNKKLLYCSRACTNGRLHSEDSKKKVIQSLKRTFSKRDTKKSKKKTCFVCGSEAFFQEKNKLKYTCKREDICRIFRRKTALISYLSFFGFSRDALGSEKIYSEYENALLRMRELYEENELSHPEIAARLNFPNAGTLYSLYQYFDLPSRDLEKGVRNYLSKGGELPKPSFSNYKTGYHTDWEGREHYYRSSYELDYMEKVLDVQKKSYESEALRILYWDSQLQKYRVAIPDFYIKEDNKIIEIKSKYTLDKVRMEDKIKAYRKAGYSFSLILEKEESNILENKEEII